MRKPEQVFLKAVENIMTTTSKTYYKLFHKEYGRFSQGEDGFFIGTDKTPFSHLGYKWDNLAVIDELFDHNDAFDRKDYEVREYTITETIL